MSTDDRFPPQGKQILPKICQVRPMPKRHEKVIWPETKERKPELNLYGIEANICFKIWSILAGLIKRNCT